jgi:Holliday junction resolvase RusA-like endonuclease
MPWSEEDLKSYETRQASNARVNQALQRIKESGQRKTPANSTQEGQKPAPMKKTVQVPPTLEGTGIASFVQIVIPGEALSQNRIWKPAIFPSRTMDIIRATLKTRGTNVLANLYQIVNEFFRGGIRLTKEAAAWKEACSSIASVQGRDLAPARMYRINLEFYGRFLNLQGEPLNKDVDNMVKLTVDAVAFGLGFNDSKFWKYGFEKIHDKGNPRTVVLITVLEPFKSVPEPLNQLALFGGEG